jgi:hypothetical protein
MRPQSRFVFAAHAITALPQVNDGASATCRSPPSPPPRISLQRNTLSLKEPGPLPAAFLSMSALQELNLDVDAWRGIEVGQS